jgi:hypothetical protein
MTIRDCWQKKGYLVRKISGSDGYDRSRDKKSRRGFKGIK